MADLATKAPHVDSGNQALLYTGATLLLIVFGIKAAMVPLHCWLPGTYATAGGAVAAVLAVMTKVGAYGIIRVFILAFGPQDSEQHWFIGEWLMPSAAVTLVLGMIGVVAARSLSQQSGF